MIKSLSSRQLRSSRAPIPQHTRCPSGTEAAGQRAGHAPRSPGSPGLCQPETGLMCAVSEAASGLGNTGWRRWEKAAQGSLYLAASH